jgi:hypothetical protein
MKTFIYLMVLLIGVGLASGCTQREQAGEPS